MTPITPPGAGEQLKAAKQRLMSAWRTEYHAAMSGTLEDEKEAAEWSARVETDFTALIAQAAEEAEAKGRRAGYQEFESLKADVLNSGGYSAEELYYAVGGAIDGALGRLSPATPTKGETERKQGTE